MPVLTCPQCSAQVHVAEGAKPSCPTCGFGDAGPRQPAAGAPPAPAAPTPSRPTAPAGGSRGKVVALTLAAVVVVAAAVTAVLVLGGGEGPRALSQEEAEEAAGLAMANLAADMQSADGGDLRVLSGSFSFDDPDMGEGTMTMEMEWGAQGTGRFLLDLSTTGGFSVSFRVEAFCAADRDVIVFGGDAYEARPDPSGASCMDEATGDVPVGEVPLLAFDAGDVPEGMEVTPHDDGTLTATFTDENDTYTLHVDEHGRATRVEVSSPEATGSFEAGYGARRSIEPPEASDRMLSSVSGSCFFMGGSCTYTASSGDDAPLSEFEVRVYAKGAKPEGGAEPLAVFALDGGDQTSGGFSFTLTENGNGTFGDGDLFTVTAPGDDHVVVVWDLWADRDVEDVPTPGPILPWVALVLVGAALARRGGR